MAATLKHGDWRCISARLRALGRTRLRALAAALCLILAPAGCDGLVEQVDEERSIIGNYAASDSLLVAFLPAPAFDEQNESPYLPDTSYRLLQTGGTLTLLLESESGNKGTAHIDLTIPDSLFIDPDSTFLLVPDTTITFESEFVTVIDRVILRPPTFEDQEAEENSFPLPLRWMVNPGATLLGEAAHPVVRPITRFDTHRGRFVTTDEVLGTLYVGATVRKE